MAEENAKKQQMEYILVGALVLVAIFIGINRFSKKEDTDNEVFSRKEFNQKWEEVEILRRETPYQEETVKYQIEEQRTPFKSPLEDRETIEVAEEDVSLPVMSFQGMVWNSYRPQAIINGSVHDVGDSIVIEGTGQKVKIQAITKDGITLRYMGKDFIVRPKK